MEHQFTLDPRKIQRGAVKIFEASRSLAKLTKQFNAVGLDIDEFINASDADALKARIASIRAATIGQPSPIANTPGANAKNARQLEIAKANEAVIKSVLTDLGIKWTPANASKGLQASDIARGISEYVNRKAAERAAMMGTKSASMLRDYNPAIPTMTREAWKKLDAKAQADFFRKGGKWLSDSDE